MDSFKKLDQQDTGFAGLRFYGGHHDSFKQYKIMEGIKEVNQKRKGTNLGKESDSESLINVYKARLKYDILFTRRVIITDSQYLDGIFWRSLIQNEKERTDFFDFLKKFDPCESPIEFRFRADSVEKSFIQFLRNGGVFSSFVDWDITESVKKAVSVANIAEQASKKTHSLGSWIEIISANLDKKEKEKFSKLVNDMKALNKLTNSKISFTYDQKSYLEYVKKAGYKQRFDSMFDHLPKNKDVDKLLDKIDKQFDISDSTSPDRKVTIEDIKELKEKYASDSDIIATLDVVLSKVSNVYNNAIALQHGCNAIDEGIVRPNDIKYHLSATGQKAALNPIDLDAGLTSKNIKFLAQQSWGDFYKLLQDNELASIRRDWFNNITANARLDEHIIESLVKKISKHEASNEKPKLKITEADVLNGLLRLSLSVICYSLTLLAGGSDVNNISTSSQAIIVNTAGQILGTPVIRYITSTCEYVNKDESNLMNVAYSNIANTRFN